MRKPATIQDVAGALGMHKSTVSLALSGKDTISTETRKRVVSAARELGYEPNLLAQRLAHGQGTTTVCLFSGVLDVGLTTEKILLVQRALNDRGMDVPIYTCSDLALKNGESTGEAQAAQVRQLCRQRPRAILCAAQRVYPAVFRELAAYQRDGGIVVSYDTPVPLECDQVVFDREDNAYQAMRYLLEQGHRKIGIGFSVGQPGGSTHSDPQEARLVGFRRALAEAGLSLREDWVFRCATYEKGGAEMAARFLQLRERPTALAIVNDYVALAFMAEALRGGVRIPEELSIIGHDNQTIAAYCPVPLTSMTHPTVRIAEAVVSLLLERIEGETSHETPPRTVVVTGELIQRQSVTHPVNQPATVAPMLEGKQ